MATSPYGQSPLLKILSEKRDSFPSPTDKAAQQLLLNKLSSDTARSLKPLPPVRSSPRLLLSVSPMRTVNGMSPKLNDVDETKYSFSEGFVPKNNVKRLVLKPRESVLCTSSTERHQSSLLNDNDAITLDDFGKSGANSTTAHGHTTNPSFGDYDDLFEPTVEQQPSEASEDGDVQLNGSVMASPLAVTTGRHSEVRDTSQLLDESMRTVHAKSRSSKSASESKYHHTVPSVDSVSNGYDDNDSDHSQLEPLVICTRSGYYCQPSVDELQKLVDDEGNCFVEGFKIGRREFGSVLWKDRYHEGQVAKFYGYFVKVFNPHPFLTVLGTGNGGVVTYLINFEHKEVTVYPNNKDKPPVGESLNRRAVITLERVWPSDQATHEPIKDIGRLERMHFWQRLKKASLKMGAKFLAYAPDTGSWSFEVEMDKNAAGAVKRFSQDGVMMHVDDTVNVEECSRYISSTVQNEQKSVHAIQSTFFRTVDEEMSEDTSMSKSMRTEKSRSFVAPSTSLPPYYARLSPLEFRDESFLDTADAETTAGVLSILPGPKHRPKLVRPRNVIRLSAYRRSLAFDRMHSMLDIDVSNVAKSLRDTTESRSSNLQIPRACWMTLYLYALHMTVVSVAELYVRLFLFVLHFGAQSKGNCLKDIFDLLLSHRIAEAAEVAQRNNYWHLSLIISQLGYACEVAALCSAQLNKWQQIKKSNGTWLQLLVDLEWTQVFSFFVWYYRGGSLCIGDAVSKYEASWQSQDPYTRVAAPLAISSTTSIVPLCGKTKYDVCYHMLKLYTNRYHPLEQLLSTFAWTTDPSDYRLSFLLWRLLCAMEYNHTSHLSKELMLSNFASQLDQNHMWPWAVFVMMHVENNAMRAWNIRSIVSRHCDDKEGVHFIINTLGVANGLVAEAKAARFHAKGLFVEETFCHLEANDWIAAHRLFVNHTGPLCVVNDRLDELKKITMLLKAHSTNIRGWSLQGEIYENYLETLISWKKYGHEHPLDREMTRHKLVTFAKKLSSMTCKTPLQRLCQGEMAIKVAELLREILDDQGYSSEAETIISLPMPDDCVIEKMLELTEIGQVEI
ncbi:unnamed protein product [Soboliphyme baturini]|uniref:Nuclear pore complex protein Nup98-Nup96 n=1 Tax=Soboliphyme baturini TaxID=241478 RepID=A0A183IUY7_9BILA|nr:unnamed protein product [Soboliphyme baturini]